MSPFFAPSHSFTCYQGPHSSNKPLNPNGQDDSTNPFVEESTNPFEQEEAEESEKNKVCFGLFFCVSGSV